MIFGKQILCIDGEKSTSLVGSSRTNWWYEFFECLPWALAVLRFETLFFLCETQEIVQKYLLWRQVNFWIAYSNHIRVPYHTFSVKLAVDRQSILNSSALPTDRWKSQSVSNINDTIDTINMYLQITPRPKWNVKILAEVVIFTWRFANSNDEKCTFTILAHNRPSTKHILVFRNPGV